MTLIYDSYNGDDVNNHENDNDDCTNINNNDNSNKIQFLG